MAMGFQCLAMRSKERCVILAVAKNLSVVTERYRNISTLAQWEANIIADHYDFASTAAC